MLKGGGQRFDVKIDLEEKENENEIVKTPTNTLMLSSPKFKALLS
jgi:hypothetical protein